MSSGFLSGESSAFFWDFVQRRIVVCYWSFGITYWFHLQVSSCPRRTAWPLKMVSIGSPETSVRKYYSTLLKIPKERGCTTLLLRYLLDNRDNTTKWILVKKFTPYYGNTMLITVLQSQTIPVVTIIPDRFKMSLRSIFLIYVIIFQLNEYCLIIALDPNGSGCWKLQISSLCNFS